MTGDCFRCGSLGVESFGNGYLCEECIPTDARGVTSPDESVPENPSDRLDNETDTQEGDRVNDSVDAPSACTPDDKNCNRPIYGTALEAIQDGPLADLGSVFVPIGPGEKGTRRPRTPEHLYAPDDPVLEAYIEAGHNYGVTCRNDLAVVDADEPDALRDLLEALPETAWQVSGSRSSEHHFLLVPGLDEDLPLVDPETDDELGHIKGAEQSYVVAPGSRHPSGNRYGPLVGSDIATVDEDELREIVDPFRPDSAERDDNSPVDRAARIGGSDGHEIDVYDVLSSASYSEGTRCDHPFHGSDTGANFMVDDGGETWRCWRHDCTGNALHLVGIDEGIISCGDWKHGGLSTDTWRDIFAAARDAGYDLPDRDPEGDCEHVAVLPQSPRARAERQVWDWRAGPTDDEHTDPLTEARERTQRVLERSLERYEARVLVEALPTLGKSSGVIRAAAATDEPITVLTGRGRKEQYDQFQAWADEQGLDAAVLPSFTHDCPTAHGDHGDEWQERVMDWYRRGATGEDIHKYAEQELGRPLPCQLSEGGEPIDCELAIAWKAIDFDDIDVLIGHYAHAHKPKVVEGRTVVFDEFPAGAYETTLDSRLPGAVTQFCQRHDGLPFDDYTDLTEHRNEESRRADALAWFLNDAEGVLRRDPDEVFAGRAGHAAAPLATFTLLAGDDLGSGWERADLEAAGDDDLEATRGLYNREEAAVTLLDPPSLERIRGVVGLDGTPTPRMWQLAIGSDLYHRQVLTDEERWEYISDGLGLQLHRTTDAVKPYNNPDYVATRQDAALLEAIRDEHDTKPGVITSSTALHEYDANEDVDLEWDPADGLGESSLVDETAYHGDVLGSNEFGETRVGAVIGSMHYGDDFIKKWAAYDGDTAERNDKKGIGLEYGAVGNEILTHMREHQTFQAAMRFGRDGNGAVVYVHTNTLPEWVPIAGEGRVLTTWSDGRRQIIDALANLKEPTTAEITDHPAVEIGARQVFDHLEALREHGVLQRQQDERDGRRLVWRDDGSGVDRLNEHGDVELGGAAIDDLGDDEVCELARRTYYTWEFMNLAGEGDGSAGDPAGEDVATDGGRPNGGDPPPDDPA